MVEENPQQLVLRSASDCHGAENQTDIWSGGFLNLDETQHIRDRGKGTARPRAESVAEVQGWQWGHGKTLDYARDGLLPRGPIPPAWMDYRGYFLHGTQVDLRYRIDGRSVIDGQRESHASDELLYRRSKAKAIHRSRCRWSN